MKLSGNSFPQTRPYLQAPSHHFKKVIPDLLNECTKVKDMLDNELEVFVVEGGRCVLQYEAHYDYMGSKSKVKSVVHIILSPYTHHQHIRSLCQVKNSITTLLA